MKYDINCVWKGEAGILPKITGWKEEKGKGDLYVLLFVKGKPRGGVQMSSALRKFRIGCYSG